MAETLKTEICVIGGGSGGFSAALRAAQSGCRTILVEKERLLGGTSTVCGVNCWEPVAGAACGLPRELYGRMCRIPGGCGIYHNALHYSLDDPARRNFPGGLFRIAPGLGYDDTLKRGYVYGGTFRHNLEYWNGVIFEPRVLDRCIRDMLREAGCRVIAGHACTEIECRDGHITSVRLDNGIRILADCWIDNCGFPAAAAGCRLSMGQDPSARYGEPDAPAESGVARLNGATLLFRVTSAKKKTPRRTGGSPRPGVMVAVEYPNGDYNCNMLPTMQGMEFFSLDRESAMEEMRRRVEDFWLYVQKNYSWGEDLRISRLFARPGIRESFRIQCRYTLNENDLVAGLKAQGHCDSVVLADHAMDLHGAPNPGRIVLPYGVPYRSLLPENTDNLLVSGRIGGFSCLAASSCRLSRTVIRLGEAAGFAAAQAVRERKTPDRIDVEKVQAQMHFQEEVSALGQFRIIR